jgi:hypothetical protein
MRDAGAYTQVLRTPRSAAIAGVLFALLYGTAIVIVRLSFPGSITERSGWQAARLPMASTGVHLLAYGGIAFLWFMGVVRTRIGLREDRFLQTVFIGSGYLFLAMTFVAGAVTSALLGAAAQAGSQVIDGDGFMLGSHVAYELVNVYSMRMAAVFMISLATICLRTGAMPCAFIWLSYAMSAVLLLSLSYTLWAALAFPLWVLGFSLYLLWRGITFEPEATG